MKRFDFGRALLAAFVVGVAGGIIAMTFGALFGVGGRESLHVWFSAWWIWVPIVLVSGIERQH